MDAQELFINFVKATLVPDIARRYSEIAKSKKGKQKILNGLYHEFESAIRPDCVSVESYDRWWNQPCFIYHLREFGTPCHTLRDAYEHFPDLGGWLIILADGSAAIHRPEDRCEDEKLVLR